MILSVSRRTDIPSYYSEWFMNRLKSGCVIIKNPMNPSQMSRVALTPETIDCIVFWTKDPVNMMDKLLQLDQMGYPYYFQYTLTPYDKNIERNLRGKGEIIKTFQELSARIGKGRVIWRYDPILINDRYSIAYHRNEFEKLCKQLSGATEQCIISFVDIYQKLNKSVKETILRNITEEEMREVAAEFVTIGRNYHIKLSACCEKLDLSGEGVHASACIDKDLIERISGKRLIVKKDKNQRLGCGCVQSIDVGIYNTCKHGCVYCYANHSDASIQKNYLLHQPEADIMIGKVTESDHIKDRKI